MNFPGLRGGPRRGGQPAGVEGFPRPRTGTRRIGAALAVVVALLGRAPFAAEAADAEGRFAGLGSGLARCSAFVEAREARSQAYFLFGGWMNGYLTARNEADADTYTLVPWQSVDLLADSLVDYCRANPDMPFLRAVAAMTTALVPDRLTRHSERVVVSIGPIRQPFFRETLHRIERRLAAAGFAPAAPDGDFTAADEAALARFQEAEGLPVSGFPDQLTLFRLFEAGREETP